MSPPVEADEWRCCLVEGFAFFVLLVDEQWTTIDDNVEVGGVEVEAINDADVEVIVVGLGGLVEDRSDLNTSLFFF
jgi:hypothetical protein